jgi:chromosome partitioning protein
MSTIAIVSQKGGSGKTTLAIHLAVCATNNGKHTFLIDTDPQATAAAWGDWRGGYLPEVITCPPARLGRTIQTATKAGSDFIVVDTPPHADMAAREAVKAADLVLVPTRLRAFDLHALEATAELIQYAKKPAYVLFNAVPARAPRQLADATKHVEGLGLKVSPVSFGDRAAFHRPSGAGEVASEINAESKASIEVDALWGWICQLGVVA